MAEWTRLGHRLGVIGRGAGWWLGDWLRYGNAEFGERYVRASRITGYDVQTLMNFVYVASRFEISRRRETLSFSHHAELAPCDPDEQDRWLERAAEERLSVRCLRVELRRAQQVEAAGKTPASNDDAAADGAHHGPGLREAVSDLFCPQCGSRFRAAVGA